EGNGWFSVAEVRFAKSAGGQPPQLQPSGFNQELATALSATLTKAPLPDDTAALKVLAQTWPKIAQRRPLEVATTFAGLRIPDSGNERSIELYERFSNLCQKLPAPVPVLAISDGTPEDEHIFIRGNHLNPGRIAPRRWMTVLRPDDQLISESSIGRLQLAEQVLAQSNPFPARVMVNRIWHHLFGEGIVGSTDNFGVLGKRPTHPELLDHLAWRFREEGWSIKRMLRSLLLSRTYRMSSQPSEAADLVDPGNELLHRFRVRRLEGEAVRDTILAVSGQLNRKMFGPSVPVYLTPFMEGRGRPASGPLNGEGRRSIYISVNRNFLSPLMLAFDVPAPVTTIGDRGVSNVPAQALILLNNEFVAEQSRLWAQRLRRDHTSAHEQLVQAWRQLLGREPMNEEVAMMEDFMAQQSAGDVSPEESLAHVCHVLLNSKEFLFLN
ncbi:MAG: DUF1553 domain-containing protein, partial [Planctomycetaceae bacterium]|nr:DUF1553 domain-containing protein [Planctomycetaceae bacterium]